MLAAEANPEGKNRGEERGKGRRPAGCYPQQDAISVAERALGEAGYPNRRNHQREGGPQAVQGRGAGAARTGNVRAAGHVDAPENRARRAPADRCPARLAHQARVATDPAGARDGFADDGRSVTGPCARHHERGRAAIGDHRPSPRQSRRLDASMEPRQPVSCMPCSATRETMR